MRHTSFPRLPSMFETWGVAFFAVLAVLLGSSHDLLQRYGLISSSQVVHDQLSKGISVGLQKLDTYSFTKNAVTFAVWAGVGLIAFSAIQAAARASAQLRYTRDISSEQYIHPASFNRQHYWQRVALDGVLSFVFSALLLLAAVWYLWGVLPYAVREAGHFLLQVRVQHVSSLCLGLLASFGGLYVVYSLAKVVRWQSRVTRRS